MKFKPLDPSKVVDLPPDHDLVDAKVMDGGIGFIKLRAEFVFIPEETATLTQKSRAIVEMLSYAIPKCQTAGIQVLAFVEDKEFAEMLRSRGFSNVEGTALVLNGK